jgi:probable O-glycosylation ligase (exosortase A-associated)
MSKQLMLMIVLTALGTLGAYILNPIYGVLVYYIFALLRPQELWAWVLPEGLNWSYYVGLSTLLAAFLSAIGGLPDPRPPAPIRPMFGRGHYIMFIFGIWTTITAYMAQHEEVAQTWVISYVKIVLMFAASSILIKTVQEIRLLIVAGVIVLIYLAFDVNIDYLQSGWLRIYFYGHGELDNNGAGLMFAMSIPLMYFLFEAITNKWRWVFLFGIPLAAHAVQMTFSRGAMLTLIAGLPLIVWRSRYRRQMMIALILFGPPFVYVTAGPEIQRRFFSIESAHEVDDSAKARLQSWAAALRIANDYPIFGVGVRNSNLFSYEYGADMEGRTIHSTYLQMAADSGYTGLGIYLFLLITVAREIVYLRRQTYHRSDEESRLYYSLTAGCECALAMFCFGTVFLSLEFFELPYFLMMCVLQMGLLYRYRHACRYDPTRFVVLPPKLPSLTLPGRILMPPGAAVQEGQKPSNNEAVACRAGQARDGVPS